MPARRAQQSTGRLVGTLGDSNAKLVAQLFGHLAGNRCVPAADEDRSDRPDTRFEPGVEAPLDAAQERLGRRHVVLAGEQEGDVDRDAGKYRLLDGGYSFL